LDSLRRSSVTIDATIDATIGATFGATFGATRGATSARGDVAPALVQESIINLTAS
jgi:hypothetical protein